MKDNIKLFQNSKIRTAWSEEKEEWYFSVIDVIEALTRSVVPRKYWNTLKTRLADEGNELFTICRQLKCGQLMAKCV